MNAIAGRIDFEVDGVRRRLVCDMNAATVLFEKYGDHWTLWLIERFVGLPVTLPGGEKGRKLEKLPPADLVGVLYALLATDREDSGVVDTEKDLRRAFGLADMPDLHVAITRAVIASFGIPGEEFEVVAGAAGDPRGSERATAHGTGTRL